MPSRLTTLSSSITEGTLKTHSFGVELPFILIECFEGLIKVVDQSAGVPSFHINIIDVGLD